ncbi:hypothetical protein D3C81_1451720 [compost metagenome]
MAANRDAICASDRWVRIPPRTARHTGGRIARRYRFPGGTGGQAQTTGTSLHRGFADPATRCRWRAMVFTLELRMPIEIREGIVESESEELLLHAPFVQHAAPVDAFAQLPCRLRIKVAQAPMPQANSATAFFTTVLSPPRQATARDQLHTSKIGSNPTPLTNPRLQPTPSSTTAAFPTSNSIIARAAADCRRCGA